jgi:hypothetical protein
VPFLVKDSQPPINIKLFEKFENHQKQVLLLVKKCDTGQASNLLLMKLP